MSDSVRIRDTSGMARVSSWLTPRRQVVLGLLVALIGARWQPAYAALLFVIWVAVVYRRPLAEWTTALRFPPGRILTTPSLLIGLVICLALLLLALFPAAFAPFDPDYQTAVVQVIDGQIMAAPFPPSSPFPLGTDVARHDLLSRIIHSTGNTLTIALSVVALRLIIGCGLGWLVAWERGGWGRLAAHLATASATIPSLLFAWVFIVAVGPGAGFTVFVLGLGLTGWAHWTHLLDDEIRRIRLQPYLEAAEALGVPPHRQLSRHILPNLLPVALPAVAQEVAAALLLLAELGFLGVFYGSGQVISPRDLSQATLHLEFHDWAGMLAGTRLEVFRHWWLPVVPAGAFSSAIVGFHLLGDGLRDVLEPASERPRPALARALDALRGRARAARPRPEESAVRRNNGKLPTDPDLDRSVSRTLERPADDPSRGRHGRA